MIDALGSSSKSGPLPALLAKTPICASVHLGPEDPRALHPVIWAPILPLQGGEAPFLNWGSKGSGHWLPTGKNTGLSYNRALLCPQHSMPSFPWKRTCQPRVCRGRRGWSCTSTVIIAFGARSPVASCALLGGRAAPRAAVLCEDRGDRSPHQGAGAAPVLTADPP